MKKIKYLISVVLIALMFSGMLLYSRTIDQQRVLTVKAAEYNSSAEKINLVTAGLEDDEKIIQGNSFTVVASLDDTTNKKIIGTYQWKLSSSKTDSDDYSSFFTSSYSGDNGNVVEILTKKKSSGRIYISCSVEYELDGVLHSVSSDTVSITISIKQSTISEIVTAFLDQRAVIIFIVGLAGAVLWNTGYRIYRFGVNHKSDYATMVQQKEFEEETREQLRKNKEEITNLLIKLCVREIENQTRPVKSLQETAEKMKSNNEILEIKLKTIDDKVNDINRLSESVKNLDAKVTRIQYGDSSSDIRRSGK